MVANGMGVTILSDMVYRPWSLEGQRVEVVSVSDDIPTMDVGLAWSRSADMSDATKAFMEFYASVNRSRTATLLFLGACLPFA